MNRLPVRPLSCDRARGTPPEHDASRDAPDRSIGEPVKILLLCSSFNGLTQRVWIELRRAGHDVSWTVMDGDDVLRATVEAVDPDLVLCPFLRERVSTTYGAPGER